MPKAAIGRLALRVEGDTWRAYYAMPGTMEDAIPLGSIRMALVAREDRKQAFMDLMRDCVADMLKAITGVIPDYWNEPQSAPENEPSDKAGTPIPAPKKR